MPFNFQWPHREEKRRMGFHPPSAAAQEEKGYGAVVVAMVVAFAEKGKAAGGEDTDCHGCFLFLFRMIGLHVGKATLSTLLSTFSLTRTVPQQLHQVESRFEHKLMLKLCAIIARSELVEQLRMRHVPQPLCMRMRDMPQL